MKPESNVVGWFEIHVADISRAKKFYQAVFQRKMADLPNLAPGLHMCAFDWVDKASGATGALVQTATAGPGGGGTLVYFSCADCAVEAARAKANGGIVRKEKASIGDFGFISIIEDTEGNTIGLHSMQ